MSTYLFSVPIIEFVICFAVASLRSFDWGATGSDSKAHKPTYPKNLVSPRISVTLF